MDDLISRQAAIDTVEFGITYAKAFDVNTGESKEFFKEGNDALKKAVERLKELPSAEPEAKPPKWVTEDRYVKNHFAEYPLCPQCNTDVTTGQCYCMICGQHIDWSEEDE